VWKESKKLDIRELISIEVFQKSGTVSKLAEISRGLLLSRESDLLGGLKLYRGLKLSKALESQVWLKLSTSS
jgi:hypothetical protein